MNQAIGEQVRAFIASCQVQTMGNKRSGLRPMPLQPGDVAAATAAERGNSEVALPLYNMVFCEGRVSRLQL